ncbi:hypothetical protein B0J13DRAFT_640842 [Dactylonectria estremocensis]|uniref:Uncharacterized protein n=1 Tax=Dactylonectria estremocensis TaxID=1079267 RepID=A0A9P9E8E6_9HYPO|nr:hypothetical protein B0J13DRAFT_640842 [Dactylonectria estremocensis]
MRTKPTYLLRDPLPNATAGSKSLGDLIIRRAHLLRIYQQRLRRSAPRVLQMVSRSEGDDTVDVDFPLDEGDCSEESATTADHHQNYTALLRDLHNAVRDSDATRDSLAMRSLIRDLCQENPA